MKIITLTNLEEILRSMKQAFGSKSLATRHRKIINNYLLDIDYDAIFNNTTGSEASAKLGTGRLGSMQLGKTV